MSFESMNPILLGEVCFFHIHPKNPTWVVPDSRTDHKLVSDMVKEIRRGKGDRHVLRHDQSSNSLVYEGPKSAKMALSYLRDLAMLKPKKTTSEKKKRKQS